MRAFSACFDAMAAVDDDLARVIDGPASAAPGGGGVGGSRRGHGVDGRVPTAAQLLEDVFSKAAAAGHGGGTLVSGVGHGLSFGTRTAGLGLGLGLGLGADPAATAGTGAGTGMMMGTPGGPVPSPMTMGTLHMTPLAPTATAHDTLPLPLSATAAALAAADASSVPPIAVYRFDAVHHHVAVLAERLAAHAGRVDRVKATFVAQQQQAAATAQARFEALSNTYLAPYLNPI